MKPEPLKTIRVIEWLEGNPYKRKRHNFNARTDLAINLPEAVFIEDLEERVQWLLKEIEKLEKHQKWVLEERLCGSTRTLRYTENSHGRGGYN